MTYLNPEEDIEALEEALLEQKRNETKYGNKVESNNK